MYIDLGKRLHFVNLITVVIFLSFFLFFRKFWIFNHGLTVTTRYRKLFHLYFCYPNKNRIIIRKDISILFHLCLIKFYFSSIIHEITYYTNPRVLYYSRLYVCVWKLLEGKFLFHCFYCHIGRHYVLSTNT